MTEQQIICGENIEVLRTYPDNYADSIVTDAPYGLGEEPDALEVMKDWINHGVHMVRLKGGFMQKAWDSFVPQPNFWKEVFRVLKPGGYVLCFFGTRTFDWGVMAMRFAGFEIRDQIDWIYATGFPKSLDISKAIDKAAGVERKVVGVGLSGAMQGANGQNSRPYHENNKNEDGRVEYKITEAATDDVKQWDGWGTALKPAHEPIVVARKPISEKTVAANVLKHGTGGINIDACRISTDDNLNGGRYSDNKIGDDGNTYGTGINKRSELDYTQPLGRFPANIIFGCYCETEVHEEGCPVKELDEQSGITTSSGGSGDKSMGGMGKNGKYCEYALDVKPANIGGLGDTGGASRFFFVAKPSDYERQRGLRNFTAKDPASVTDFRPTLKSNPENWANGTETPYNRTTQKKNVHPTVKPVELMRYLVRLVTPKGGICVDPFNGSGTTGIACKLEDVNYIGIEQNEYDCEVSRARIAAWPNIKLNNLF